MRAADQAGTAGMYELMTAEMASLMETDAYFLPVLANASALLWHTLPDLNWAGFYLVRSGMLVLGPFQGKPACIHIQRGRGVCGTAWERDETVVVEDVHAFPGHIACDSASRSEIVVPIHANGEIMGVLDLDSPREGRFSQTDREGLEAFVRVLESAVCW